MEKRIFDFLSDFTGFRIDKIKRETSIESELKVYGDDGDDLLLKFSDKFNVDISEVNPSLYFGDEGLRSGDILLAFLYLVSGRKVKSKLEPLCVGDLIEAAHVGKLTPVYTHYNGKAHRSMRNPTLVDRWLKVMSRLVGFLFEVSFVIVTFFIVMSFILYLSKVW